MWRRSVVAVVVVFGLSSLVPFAAEEQPAPRSEDLMLIARLARDRPALLDPRLQKEVSRRAAGGRFWSLAAGVYLSGLGDWATTRRFRDEGIEEANPLVGPLADSPAGLAALKLGGASLVNQVSYTLKKRGRRYWAVPQIVWISLNVVVSIHNAQAAD